MRTYTTYAILGIIGFIVLKFLKIELNLGIILTGIVLIPIAEYLINIKHHRQNALYKRKKRMSAEELDILTGSEPQKSIETFRSALRTKPRSFGYKTNWIVVKSKQSKELLNILKYEKLVETNWEIGVDATFQNRKLRFICPSLNNWTIIVGESIDYVNSISAKRKLSELSKRYGETYYFGSYRGTGYASWAKYINGKEERAFLLDDGDVFYSYGELEEEEKELVTERKFALEKKNKEDVEYHQKYDFLSLLGTEDDVLLMAEKWTINPMELHMFDNNELGYLIE